MSPPGEETIHETIGRLLERSERLVSICENNEKRLDNITSQVY